MSPLSLFPSVIDDRFEEEILGLTFKYTNKDSLGNLFLEKTNLMKRSKRGGCFLNIEDIFNLNTPNHGQYSASLNFLENYKPDELKQVLEKLNIIENHIKDGKIIDSNHYSYDDELYSYSFICKKNLDFEIHKIADENNALCEKSSKSCISILMTYFAKFKSKAVKEVGNSLQFNIDRVKRRIESIEYEKNRKAYNERSKQQREAEERIKKYKIEQERIRKFNDRLKGFEATCEVFGFKKKSNGFSECIKDLYLEYLNKENTALILNTIKQNQEFMSASSEAQARALRDQTQLQKEIAQQQQTEKTIGMLNNYLNSLYPSPSPSITCQTYGDITTCR